MQIGVIFYFSSLESILAFTASWTIRI